MRSFGKLVYLGVCFALALGAWIGSSFVDIRALDLGLKLTGWMSALFSVPVALLWLAEWIAPERSPEGDARAPRPAPAPVQRGSGRRAA
ncbi:MAG: hypothetical protein ACTS3F_04915 [Phycisphaerales bacterium]